MDANNIDSYPAQFSIQRDEKLANWRAIGHHFMAIPHFIVLYVLGAVAQVCAVVSWFAILFTGSMPEGLANMIVMAQRYQNRVLSYTFWMRESYPAFEFDGRPADPRNDPAVSDYMVSLNDRDRLNVALRIIFAIPSLLFGILVELGVGACVIIGFFTVLFTGKVPQGVSDFMVKGLRYGTRLGSYLYLLHDQAPPLSLD